MNDDLLQVYSRLSVHEYFLEVMYANIFAQMDEAATKELAARIRANLRQSQIAPGSSQQAAEAFGLQIAQYSAAMSERLLSKIEARAASIKAEPPQRKADQ
jgi:hypothetical protein